MAILLSPMETVQLMALQALIVPKLCGCGCRWLGSIVERLFKETGVYGTDRPNHVLLNGYSPGQGIFNHQDGPIYHPAVCILSLGSTAVMNFRRRLPEGVPSFEASHITPSAQIYNLFSECGMLFCCLLCRWV